MQMGVSAFDATSSALHYPLTLLPHPPQPPLPSNLPHQNLTQLTVPFPMVSGSKYYSEAAGRPRRDIIGRPFGLVPSGAMVVVGSWRAHRSVPSLLFDRASTIVAG